MTGTTDPRLPNLLIIGVPKAGTTSLFAYLAQHPDVGACRLKEPGYFMHLRDGGPPRMTLEEYAALFADTGEVRYRLEATPRYAFGGPALIDGVHRTLDQPRALLVLRDPAERLWSSYWSQTYSKGGQRNELRKGLDRTVEAFMARCERVRASSATRDRGHPDWVAQRLMYEGDYGAWLGDWLQTCGDRLRIVFFDDLRDRPDAVTRGVFGWLGLPEDVPLDVGARNPTVTPRSRVLHTTGQRVRRLIALRDRAPGIDAAATRLYRRVNTTPGAPRRLDASTHQRLSALYAGSLATTARLLGDRGHDRLPGWLADTGQSGQSSRADTPQGVEPEAASRIARAAEGSSTA